MKEYYNVFYLMFLFNCGFLFYTFFFFFSFIGITISLQFFLYNGTPNFSETRKHEWNVTMFPDKKLNKLFLFCSFIAKDAIFKRSLFLFFDFYEMIIRQIKTKIFLLCYI